MSSRKILIVEDEAILALDLSTQLTDLGFHVAGIASSGESAIEQSEREHPDLVLMDIKIKGSLDGVETAELLLSRMDIPVLYCTAYSDEDLLNRAKLTRPYGYLIKPINARELAANIEMAISSHRAEQKLRKSEAWLASVLSSIGDAVTTADENGKISYMNPVAEALSGRTTSESAGMPVLSVFPLMDEISGKPVVLPSPEGSRLAMPAAIPRKSLLQRTDGRLVPVDGNVSSLLDHLGRETGSIVTLRDMTEYRRMEARVMNLERFQIFSQIASGVAHEVRNPLNAIMAVTEAMVQDLGSDPGAIEYLGHIRTQVQRLATLMKDLLDLGKPIQPSSMRKESISAICEMGILLWKQSASKSRIDVLYDQGRDDEPMTVIANADRLQQVIFNLLENAARHSPPDSRIEINVSRSSDGYIRVQLKDQGCGIPGENIGIVFDPFFTTSKNGIGLGLSIVKNIVEQHEGRVALKNNDPPPGCTAMIELPEAEKKT
jgi:PAS domain S-box-containing protein